MFIYEILSQTKRFIDNSLNIEKEFSTKIYRGIMLFEKICSVTVALMSRTLERSFVMPPVLRESDEICIRPKRHCGLRDGQVR